ncbi:hypothetical protein P280DRAFT_505563 [Massarina eburnea CBS 473.64]|uniref:SMP-LTD domain-containing protein n=1 Tax=Massarina eburnea CBS 473.64 TaxID=1395130 RepID=A0A6A6S6T1_9PLEO|nr:hypothetical protein P280DRAFT_505563 [Massarina eburnea CBS 473.64]
MASPLLLVAAYILGGITFLPLCLILVLCHAYFTLPRYEPIKPQVESPRKRVKPDSLHESRTHHPHLPDVAASYFAVCREYVPGGVNGRPPERTTSVGAGFASESPSVYQNMYRSIFDRNKTTSPSVENGRKGRNVFYVVLRHGHLMLYDDAEQLEVRHVIALANYEVDVFAGGEPVPEGELWIKRNCIRLRQRAKVEGINAPSRPFYMFSDNCSEKEDFYHAILQNSEYPSSSDLERPLPLRIDTPDLISLVQQLHASEENLHTRWINALVGRLFLALYKTSDIENSVRIKINKKIARVSKPAFISSISIQRIDMGILPPFITNPRLKELSMEGDLVLEADVSYRGNFRLDISAVARIELGTRFKAREVTLVLASILKKLDGHVLLRVKPPPSNRLWVAFETPPKMELSLEPIVSTRQITYGVILRAIESRIREVVNETLVLPNWDDMPFTNTLSEELRGGLWERSRSNIQKLDKREIEKHQSETHQFETTTPRSDPSSMQSIDTAQNAKISEQNSSIYSRTSTPSYSDLTTECISTSSSIKSRSSIKKPKRIRSGSFSSVASPIVDIDAPKASTSCLDERECIPNATISPPQIKALEEPSTTLLPSASQSSFESHAGLQGREEEIIFSTGIQDEEQKPPNQEMPPHIDPPALEPENTESSRSYTNSPNILTRRPTINQSLNTATAAAKKWLNNRQRSEPSWSAHVKDDNLGQLPSNTFTETHGNEYDTLVKSIPPVVIPEGAQPIGRGQPLPPPGTPLPPPPKVEKRIWSVPVPTASTFANLTRRKSTVKQPGVSTSDEPSNRTIASSSLGHSDISPSEQRMDRRTQLVRNEASTSSFSTTAQSNTPPPLPKRKPPPLPKRRQRLSVAETKDTGTEQDIFVVAAPDGSVPTSPTDSVEHFSLDSSSQEIWKGHVPES